MKHVSDAMTLRKKLFDQLEKASLPCVSREEAEGLLHVAIVGGGPTGKQHPSLLPSSSLPQITHQPTHHPGVEITAELSDLARRELKDLYPSVAPLLRISIYDVAPHILGVYDQKLYEYATERMVQRGVEVATGCIIERVDSSNLHIKGRAQPVPYGILLWVAGNKSVPLIDGLDAKKSEKGLVRVLTDERLRVKWKTQSSDDGQDVFPDVFALGDAADIDGASLPTTAEVAVQKARYLVQQLNSRAKQLKSHSSSSSKTDSEPTKPFRVRTRRLVTYIGYHDGIVQGSTISDPWSGRQAWLSWRSGSFTWTRSWRNWIGILLAWLLNALFGRDVMRL